MTRRRCLGRRRQLPIGAGLGVGSVWLVHRGREQLYIAGQKRIQALVIVVQRRVGINLDLDPITQPFLDEFFEQLMIFNGFPSATR